MCPNSLMRTSEPLLDRDNGFFDGLCPPEGDLSFTMSGRCGILQCLEDIKMFDDKRVAYLPMYTCETVAAPFHKAGYTIVFYEVDKDLSSIFDHGVLDKISVLSLCGYYGFCSYDHEFVKECHDRRIVIIEDVTHSLFSDDGIDPLCDYVTGSLRKWIDVVSGGFALKRQGKFSVSCHAPNEEHLALRRKYIEDHDTAAFWEAEMMLRRIFDLYHGDESSEYLMRHVDIDEIKLRRRKNYKLLMDLLPAELHGLRPVLPALTERAVPSHVPFYAEDREHFLAYLKEKDVPYKVFWPVGPLVDLDGHDTVRYIYDHITALFCDQHRSTADMERLAEILSLYPGP